MDCCRRLRGIEARFGQKRTQSEVNAYLKKGLTASAQALFNEVVATRIEGSDILDIGFGVGALPLELLKAGAKRARGLELSPAYIQAANNLASQLGFGDRVCYQQGNIAEDGDIAVADVVVMHRVVCCYPDMPKLMTAAAKHTRRLLAVSYPRATWWVRLGLTLENMGHALRRCDFRVYVHAPDGIRETVEFQGMKRLRLVRSGEWEIALFKRT